MSLDLITQKLERFDEGPGIEAVLVANNAQYHHTYMQAKIQQDKTAKNKKTNTQNRKWEPRYSSYKKSALDHIHAYQAWNI